MELVSVAQRRIAVLDHIHEELVTLQTFLMDDIHQFLNDSKYTIALTITNCLQIQLGRTAICLDQCIAQSLLSISNRVVTSNVALVAIDSQLDQIRINSHN